MLRAAVLRVLARAPAQVQVQALVVLLVLCPEGQAQWQVLVALLVLCPVGQTRWQTLVVLLALASQRWVPSVICLARASCWRTLCYVRPVLPLRLARALVL